MADDDDINSNKKDNVLSFSRDRRPRSSKTPPQTPSAKVIGTQHAMCLELLIFEFMIQSGEVMVGFMYDADGVVAPELCRERPQLNFSIGYQAPGFAFDIKGVRAELSFSGRNLPVDLPWSSVRWMYAKKHPEDLVMFPNKMSAQEPAQKDSNQP